MDVDAPPKPPNEKPLVLDVPLFNVPNPVNPLPKFEVAPDALPKSGAFDDVDEGELTGMVDLRPPNGLLLPNTAPPDVGEVALGAEPNTLVEF